MAEDIVKITKGNGFPLGAKKVGRRQWQFSVAMEKNKEITLELFKQGEKKKAYSLVLDKTYLVGGIYSVILTFGKEEYAEYIYRVNGKVKLDPYARQITGREEFGRCVEEEEEQVHCCLVQEEKAISEPLHLPFHQMILYHLHVRGFTKHISSKVKHRGTFKGIVEKIPYLKQLGINGIMLMPCYDFDERMEEQELGNNGICYLDYTMPLKEDGKKKAWSRVNFWGYTRKACYFSPKSSFASDPSRPIQEMKQMVAKLHENGIEVFMEIYFAPGTNQTLILDCLRYWVREFAIDGFKINNEVVMGNMVASDPYLTQTKFLATTWDTRQMYECYETVDNKTLADYNDGFLVDCRRFLKGDEGQVDAFLNRMRNNPPQKAVINYISNVNGFTLMDMVSYDVKHNEANGENGQDGSEYNYSWNCGWEGATRKKQVVQLRLRQIKNALIMVMLSQGVPMIMAGDEFGNTQCGNNNAYCQDNEIGWVTWNKQVMNQRILAFTKKLIALRKEHPVFSAKRELRGMDYIACGCPDISFHGTKPWYPDMSNYSRVVGIMLYGKYAPLSIRKSDKAFYLAFNMHWEEHSFALPVLPKDKKWKVILDTSEVDLKASETEEKEGILKYMVKARTIVIFQEMD